MENLLRNSVATAAAKCTEHPAIDKIHAAVHFVNEFSTFY